MSKIIRLMQGFFSCKNDLPKPPHTNRAYQICRTLRARALNRIARLLKKPGRLSPDSARLPIFFIITGATTIHAGYTREAGSTILKNPEWLKKMLMVRRIPQIEKTSIAEFCEVYKN